MTSYTVIKSADGEILSILRDDGASIPVCGGNSDYQQYLTDNEMRGPYHEEIIPDPVVSPVKSLEEQISDLRAALFEMEGI